MSTVILIGNGFDLNLGLKTSYKDFVNSEQFKQHIGDSCLFDHLAEDDKNPLWIDIEKELETYSTNNYIDTQNFKNQYKKLCEALKGYISAIDINAIDENSDAYKLLKNEAKDDFQIINFNYTDSAYHILKKLGHGDDIRQKILHVHGSININNIIFGVDDKAGINRNHTFLYKSTSEIYNGRQIIKALNEFNKLYIFGHSLGDSDHMYFDFFHRLSLANRDISNEKSINIHHHNEESKLKTYQQLHKLTGHKVSKLKNTVLFQDVSQYNI